jgi:hypothetical protein
MRELNQDEIAGVDGGNFWVGIAVGAAWDSIKGIGGAMGSYFGQDNGGPQTWEVTQNQYVY